MSERGDLDALIEACVSAHRTTDVAGRLVPPPEWHDLSPEHLDEVYARQRLQRGLERASSPDGLTATARAVLARIGELR